MSQVHRSTDGVVLLHGIARTSASMRAMQRALEAAGYPVLNLAYRSRHLPRACWAWRTTRGGSSPETGR